MDLLRLEAIYGRWRMVKGWNVELSSKHLGKIMEFSSKYIIVDDVQYNHPPYLYDIVPDFASINAYSDTSSDDNCFYSSTHDYKNRPLLEYSKHLKVMFEIFFAYKDFFDDSIRVYHLVKKDLIIDAFGNWYEKIEDRPLWELIKSYLKAVFTRSNYNPKAIVPKDMWGQWELVDFSPIRYWYISSGYREMSDPTGESIEKQGRAMIGRRFFFHPNYVILDDIQYNRTRYYVEFRRGLEVYDQKTYAISLDDYNGYKLGTRRLSNCSFPQIGLDINSNQFSFYMPYDNELHFVVGLVDFTCRHLPNPSLWQCLKYYFNYLLGIDASAKGFLNFYKLEEKNNDPDGT
jgi:hypothetical protein